MSLVMNHEREVIRVIVPETPEWLHGASSFLVARPSLGNIPVLLGLAMLSFIGILNQPVFSLSLTKAVHKPEHAAPIALHSPVRLAYGNPEVSDVTTTSGRNERALARIAQRAALATEQELTNLADARKLQGTRDEYNATLEQARAAIVVAQHAGVDLGELPALVTGYVAKEQNSNAPHDRRLLTAGLIKVDTEVHSAMAVQMPEKVILISLDEQAFRAYEHGRLVRFAYVTTGRPELPTVTGTFQIYTKLHDFKLKSPWAQGSPFYYPPTTVHYWMPFYSGYALHDAYWRSTFGPGTNQAQGTVTGSHGCVNVSTSEAAWMWDWTNVGTTVIVY